MITAIRPEREPLITRASHTDEELDRFAEFIAAAFCKPGAIESLCSRVDQLLEKAKSARR